MKNLDDAAINVFVDNNLAWLPIKSELVFRFTAVC